VAIASLASLAILGCSRAPADSSASNDRARALERRCVQLEQDYRTASQARDKVRLELGEAQAQLAQQADSLKELGEQRKRLMQALADGEHARKLLVQRTTERDNLRSELATRMTEREVLTNRCDKLRRGLQTLLTQDDTGNNNPAGAAAGSE
jgi:septal ring factor EnvC (AmiA/AmiB activator)